MNSSEFINIENHLITFMPGAEKKIYSHGKGACLFDEEGKSYINMNDISCNLGYDHPRFREALSEIVLTKMLAHGSAYSRDKELLIKNFMEVTHGDFDKIFFSASGGETVDWALKVARRHTGKDGIISFHKSLHGRSFAGAFISGTPVRKEGFGSGLENVYFWDFPSDGRSFEESADQYENIAGIIIEPYQAIGGMCTPSKEYWKWLREYTRDKGIVLIFDEIQTGFGKTGSFFAYEEAGIIPDILLVGKGMSNGFGLGAMLMSREVAASIRPNEMSGGSADNDFMCSVVNTVFEIYRDEDILSHVEANGKWLRKKLEGIFEEKKIPFKINGKGLFLSLELPEGMAERVVSLAKEDGILFGRSGNMLMMRPPLVITRENLKEVCEVLSKYQ